MTEDELRDICLEIAEEIMGKSAGMAPLTRQTNILMSLCTRMQTVGKASSLSECNVESPADVCAECRVLDAKYVDERAARIAAEEERDHYEKLWHIEKREHATALKERDEARREQEGGAHDRG